MKICSVIVGIQHYNGVEDVVTGSEVVLCFDEENRYSEDTIVVKNETGEVVGNIISNLNHPSVSEEVIALNDVKNDNAIRKLTKSNCKATIKRITKYVIFIVVDTDDVVEFNDGIDEKIQAIEKEIALLEAKKAELLAKKENGVDDMELKDLLKEEFDGIEISGDAWDLSKSLNQFSRKIQAITGEHTSSKTTIMAGGKGKFVWIQYHDENDILGDGGIASGSIEDAPIHYDGRFYDDINYSKIAFALIPVDDF